MNFAESPAPRMETVEIELRAPEGDTQPGLLLRCAECQGDAFYVYFLLGKYQHLQCKECGTSYCAHKGPCGGEREGGQHEAV